MQNTLLFIGTTELLLIGGIALLLFGGKKLPEMMHGLGQGVREFKKGVNETKDDVKDEDSNENAPDDDSQEKQETITHDRKQEKSDGKGK